jgi:Vitamin K-dependent gamma-carboxylase
MQAETSRRRPLQFWFQRQSDDWISILRVGLGLQVIFFTLALRKDWIYLLAGNGSGLISRDLTEAVFGVEAAAVPRLGWLVGIGSHIGLSEQTLLAVVWVVLLMVGFALLAGIFCRTSAIISWFLHLGVVKSADFFSYGVDNLTTIGLFYLMICPLPDRYSLDARFRNLSKPDTRLVGFHRRILQIHLCLIYFFGGIAKCAGIGWWNGTSVWRALTLPPFNFVDAEMLRHWSFMLPVAGALICLLETAYPFFIWHSKTRKIWLIGICAMHVGIGLTMGMYLFAFVMIILNLAAFGPGLIRTEPGTSQPAIVGRAHKLAGNEHSFGCGFSAARIPICSRRPRTAAVRIRSTRG